MASSKKVDLCMFCGAAPCECNKSAPKLVKIPKPKPEVKIKPDKVSVVADAKIDLRAAMRKQSAPPPPISEKTDAELYKAIRTLAPILHPDERERYASIIKQSIQERREAWKARIR